MFFEILSLTPPFKYIVYTITPHGTHVSGATKGGLMSEEFFTWAQIFKQKCQITPLSTLHKGESAQGSDLAKVKNFLRLSHL